MHRLRYLVPSPQALITFEAAGRLNSFTKAAAELNVSQAAVSLAVRRLEDTMGVTLFRREHRRISLTEAGSRLFQDVSIGLDHIARSVEGIRRDHAPGAVTFSVSTAFAGFWLLPRLTRLKDRLPGLDLRVQTTDRDVDLVAEGLTMGIRRGDGDFPSYDMVKLADEEIVAVCSPRYLMEVGPVRTAEDVLQHRLIHLDEPYRPRPSWADWAAGLGLSKPAIPREGVHLNDYALVLQAALEGDGIALGFRHVTQEMVRAGRLVEPVEATVVTGQAFWLVWPKGAGFSDAAAAFRDFICAEFDVRT
ncbi:MAG: LysR substrate-binding domain-containing protein [Alphaproteobacteria bacterium]